MNEKVVEIFVGSYNMMCVFFDVMNFILWKYVVFIFINFELDFKKFNCYIFYCVILENVVMIIKGNIDIVKEFIGNMLESIVFVGGVFKSLLWCQILFDVIGLLICVLVVKEVIGFGVVILVGYGVGIYIDILKIVNELVFWDKIYQFNEKNYGLYEKFYNKWRNVYVV